MHELGITLQIVESVARHANGSAVRRVVLEIGKLTAVLPDAIRFCFDLCAEGTVVEGAVLEILEIPGLARCRACGADVPLERFFGRCLCGNSDLDWIKGEELRILEMELA
jgi:hydrogenase nickel incorporation protein HypA/HybF